MKRILLQLAVVLALVASAAPARSSACSIDQYLHNGSVMDVQICDGGVLAISYAQPRPGMAKAGARPGSLLFDGTEGPTGVISGRSRLFSARCGVLMYAVTGTRQGNSIILRGNAPVRGRGCRVVQYRHDNLVFTPAPAPAPTPTCPPGYAYTQGQCVVAGGGAPAPVPGPAVGNWYAIAGSFRNRGPARARAGQLGGGAWHVMNTNQCPKFRNGFWITTAGPFAKGQAQAYASTARRFGAYIKACH